MNYDEVQTIGYEQLFRLTPFIVTLRKYFSSTLLYIVMNIDVVM